MYVTSSEYLMHWFLHTIYIKYAVAYGLHYEQTMGYITIYTAYNIPSTYPLVRLRLPWIIYLYYIILFTLD